MSVSYFLISLDDGKEQVKLATPNVTWLEGGDSKVRIRAYVSVDEGKILDEWESDEIKIKAKIEPKCERECPEEIEEYMSQEGTAKITWIYNPDDESEILLEFEVVE